MSRQDARAAARMADLAEEFLPLVGELAAELDEGLMPHEDFLQEGYLGLTLALGELADMDADTYGGISMEEAVETAVRRQLAEANARQKALSEKDDRLIVQAELLKKSIDRLTEEFGDKPTVDELANDLMIPQDKVLDILKLMGDVDD